MMYKGRCLKIEILTETVKTADYVIQIVMTLVSGILTTLATALCTKTVIKEKKAMYFTPAILFGILSITLFFVLLITIKKGPEIEYISLVDDYNEVYEQGYEVVRHEGKLVILKKVEQ